MKYRKKPVEVEGIKCCFCEAKINNPAKYRKKSFDQRMGACQIIQMAFEEGRITGKIEAFEENCRDNEARIK